MRTAPWWDVVEREYHEEGVVGMYRARSAAEAIKKHRALVKVPAWQEESAADYCAHRTDSVLHSLLGLVGRRVTLKQVNSWSRKQVTAASEWASAVHLAASDNPVKPPPMPRCVRVLPEIRL